MRQYLSVESLFMGQPSQDAVITQLIKDNKDNLGNVLLTAQAHQQLVYRNRVILSLLRGVQSLGDR